MNNEQDSGANYRHPLDFSEVDRLLARQHRKLSNPPHHAPESTPLHSSTAHSDLTAQCRKTSALSVSVEEICSYTAKPKSAPTGRQRIHPLADQMLREKFSQPVAQPHQTVMQKLAVKLRAVWRHLTARFN